MESSLYFLETTVEAGTSTAHFDLSLTTLSTTSIRGDDPVLFSCADLYARPLDPPEDKTGSVKNKSPAWNLKITPERKSADMYKGSVGSLYAAGDATIRQPFDKWQAEHQDKMEQHFSYVGKTPSLTTDSSGKIHLALPPLWQMSTNDANLFSKAGLMPLTRQEAKVEITAGGSISISNMGETVLDIYSSYSASQPGLTFSAGEAINLYEPPGERESQLTLLEKDKPQETVIVFRSLRFQPEAIDFQIRPDELGSANTSNLKTALNEGLTKALREADLKTSLLVVGDSWRENSLQIQARQDLGEVPLVIHVDWNQPFMKAMNLETDGAAFHFGKNRYDAASLNLLDKLDIGPYKKTGSTDSRPWINPLKIIAPFSVVCHGHEARSYISNQGFYHVLAYVTENLRVSPCANIQTLTKDNRLTLHFFNADLQPCIFLAPFRLFLIMKVKRPLPK